MFKFRGINISRKGRVWSTYFYKCIRVESTHSISEHNQAATYPPILDISKKAVKRRERESLHEKYRKLHTVEEKLFAVNLPKYYGWKSLILREGSYPYNFLPFIKQITKTSAIEVDSPTFKAVQGQTENEEFRQLCELIRPQLQEALMFELKGRRWRHELDESGKIMSNAELADIITSSLIEQINRTVLGNLSSFNPHILESVVDSKPRLEAFWTVGGFSPSEELYKERDGNKKLSLEEKAEPLEHWIQYLGNPSLQLRSSLPLQELTLDATKELGTTDEVALMNEEKPDPTLAFGLEFERRHGTNIPGFWPGEKCEYGLLSYHNQGYLLDRPPHFGSEEFQSTLDGQGILASFAWLHAQAAYQGFSTFNEITYPLTTQTIITDGCSFSFYLYQLNTVLFHSDSLNSNPRRNVCLTQKTRKLYQDIVDNKFVGWDDDVLSTLIGCYLNEPKKREYEMKPNVNSKEPYLADIEEGERRVWLHKQFRHMYSNRPRHFLKYEIYDWERIYKIKFESRPLEARQRPFELEENPMEERKYYEHLPPYIPKKFRTKKKHWTGWRANYAKKYYPNL